VLLNAGRSDYKKGKRTKSLLQGYCGSLDRPEILI